jgi:shikimate dehydrogenase
VLKFGLLGKVLGHSWSPQIHERFFREMALSGTYELVEVPESEVVDFLVHAGEHYDGLNVTIPYKVTALRQTRKVTREARAIGAVNTLKFSGREVSGFNTDYLGFRRLLEHNGIAVENQTVVVLGSGGAARAVLQALLDQRPHQVMVVVRNPAKAKEELKDVFERASRLSLTDYAHIAELPRHDVIVNTTPVGMYPNSGVSPVPATVFAGTRCAAVDIVYNPVETEFMRQAREAGCFACNGLYMLVAQALASEEIWLERPISPDLTALIAREMEAWLHA